MSENHSQSNGSEMDRPLTPATRWRSVVVSARSPVKDSVRGFVYEVETGRLREVRQPWSFAGNGSPRSPATHTRARRSGIAVGIRSRRDEDGPGGHAQGRT